MLFCDTHVVVWLYAGLVERFSPEGRRLLESEPLAVCPIVQLELAYLREINRIAAEPALMLESLQAHIGLAVVEQSLVQVVSEACLLDWTRDPFDRLIVASAAVAAAPLLTKDEFIRQHYAKAVW